MKDIIPYDATQASYRAYVRLAEQFQSQRKLGRYFVVRLLGGVLLMLAGGLSFIFLIVTRSYLAASIVGLLTLVLWLEIIRPLNRAIEAHYDDQVREFANRHPNYPDFYVFYTAMVEQARENEKYAKMTSRR